LARRGGVRSLCRYSDISSKGAARGLGHRFGGVWLGVVETDYSR
jgi:hypothetical protein